MGKCQIDFEHTDILSLFEVDFKGRKGSLRVLTVTIVRNTFYMVT